MEGRGYSSICFMVKSIGATTGKRAGTTLLRSTELQRQKHVAKLLTSKNQQQLTDWYTVPQTETAWLFLSKCCSNWRQIAAAAHSKGGYDMFYKKMMVSHALPMYSVIPAQNDIKNPIMKNKEGLWRINSTFFLGEHLFFFSLWEFPSPFIYESCGINCFSLVFYLYLYKFDFSISSGRPLSYPSKSIV